MEINRHILLRYSKAFKQKVIKEIEEGNLSITEARKLYDIRGSGTIQGWIKKLGKNHLLNKVVNIKTVGEVNKLKQTEKQKQELESALAHAHLRIMSLEKMLDIAGLEYGEDFKKKYDMKVSKK